MGANLRELLVAILRLLFFVYLFDIIVYFVFTPFLLSICAIWNHKTNRKMWLRRQ